MNRSHSPLAVAVGVAAAEAEVVDEAAAECAWEAVVEECLEVEAVCRGLPWGGLRRLVARLLPHDRQGEAPVPPLVHVPPGRALAADKLVAHALVALVPAAGKLAVLGRSLVLRQV